MRNLIISAKAHRLKPVVLTLFMENKKILSIVEQGMELEDLNNLAPDCLLPQLDKMREEVMRYPSSISEAGKKGQMRQISPFSTFCSIQALNRLDGARLYW